MSLSLLLIVNISKANAQSDFLTDIQAHKQVIKNLVLYKIKKEASAYGAEPSRTDIVVTPVCRFRATSKLSLVMEPLKHFTVYADTAILAYELVFDQKLYGLPMTRFIQGPVLSDINDDKRQLSYNSQLKMVKQAMQFSQDIFFVDFWSQEAPGNYPIAYLENKTVKIVDKDLNLYSSIEEFILKIYGSVEKYIEMSIEDSIKKEASKNISSILYCKNMLKSDYHYWEVYRKTDTSQIVYLFIKEITSFANLTESQATLLKNKLMALFLTPKTIKYNCPVDISLLNRDITSLVKGILTEEQYSNYKKNVSRKNTLKLLSVNKLQEYLIRVKNVSADRVDNEISKYVFAESKE